jgi:hypothetical protein
MPTAEFSINERTKNALYCDQHASGSSGYNNGLKMCAECHWFLHKKYFYFTYHAIFHNTSKF